MIVSHSHKFIFVKTMKTASTSLELALLKACETGDICAQIRPKVEGIPSNFNALSRGAQFTNASNGKITLRQHSPLFQVARIFGRAVLDYKIITSERNPWTKLVSSFFWKAHQTPEELGFSQDTPKDQDLQSHFETFVHQPVRNACDAFDMYSHQWMPLADHIIRYEALEEDLAHVADALSLPRAVSLPVKKARQVDRPPSVGLEYTPEMDAIVHQRFAREIALFNYTNENKTSTKYQPHSSMMAWREAFLGHHFEAGWSNARPA